MRDGNLPTCADELVSATTVATPNVTVAPVSTGDNNDLDLAISLLESAKQILQ